MISRRACVRQCRELERRQARRRFISRPASEVPVSTEARASALARPFVNHLGRIQAQEEDVLQAVQHFIQFNIEKHRLASEGEIPDGEWGDRSERLRQRWNNLMLRAKRESTTQSQRATGYKLLEDTTYFHHEPLNGELCTEISMTSGHYHRLADDDIVWWDLTFTPSRN